MKKRTIIVTGLAATYPLGGVAWDYLQYLHGLVRLGHDAYYLEDTGGWTFDPVQMTFTDDASYNARYLGEFLARLDPALTGRWCLRDTYDNHWGLSREELAQVVARAELFINVSTTCQLREEYEAIPVKVLIDSDPLYTQASIPAYQNGTASDKEVAAIEAMRRHDVFFSFGENVGRPGCLVPTGVFDWRPTRQPIVLDDWAPTGPPAREVFTTVLSWKPVEKGPVVGGVEYGGKNLEFERMIDLPGRTDAVLELALGGGQAPKDTLTAHGWRLVDGIAMSSTPWVYRDYIKDSLAEFSTAKNAYVASRSGWFSCRSACYMASGRPVVVQDTGFSDFIPTGLGVVAYSTPEEALDGLARVRADWPAHAEAARTLAAEFFDAATVLDKLIREATS